MSLDDLSMPSAWDRQIRKTVIIIERERINTMGTIGFRIHSEIERAPKDLIEKYYGVPVANIADNMGRISCVEQSIKPFNKIKLLGSAFTVRVPAGDNLMFHKAIAMAEAGDVIVVDGGGDMNRSLCGELMMYTSMVKGIKGFLIDGCIRDVETLMGLDFSVYARGVQPNGPYKNGPGEINVPVSIGGKVVCPGDIIVGDLDGVVIIKKEDAEDLLIKANKHQLMEEGKLASILNGTLDRSWIDIALKNKGCEFL